MAHGTTRRVNAQRLIEIYGPDPQEVGAEDGTEDDYGDLLLDAAEEIGWPYESMSDEEWQHFQQVALDCRSTNMQDWLAHLAAITREETTA